MKDSSISLGAATAVGLGAIIGAGIFTLSGTAIALAGPYTLLAFVLVGVVAIIVALELGELCAIYPKLSGASYSYVYETFGSELGFITGILLYFSYASSISVVALGFGSYLTSLLGLSAPADSDYFAIGLILMLTLVNLGGISKAARADLVLVLVKLAILMAVVIFALLYFAHNGSATDFSASNISNYGIGGILSASVAVFFAYSGFQSISTFAANIKGGARNAARAIFLSVAISMFFYVLIAVALLILVPVGKFSIGADPLSFALITAGAPNYFLIIVDIGALVATTSASLALLLSSSRILYQISSDGLLPKALRSYDQKRDVARNGVLISSAIGIIMLFSGNIFVMAAISNFGLLFSYLMATFTLIQSRREGRPSSFSVPLYPYLPVLAMISIFTLMLGMPKEALVIGVIFILSLIILYYVLTGIERKEPAKIRLFD